MRFYFEAGEEKLTKAVLITNKTNVKELLPILIEKFNLSKDIRQCVLFVVHENGKITFSDLYATGDVPGYTRTEGSPEALCE